MSKKMTPEEAKKILAAAKAREVVDPSDGSVMSSGGGPDIADIVKASDILREIEFKREMSVQEAKDILKKNEEYEQQYTGGSDFFKVAHANDVLAQARHEESRKIISGQIRPFEAELHSPKGAYEILRLNAISERKKPFFKQLFSKKEKPFYWENPLEWQDVKFQSNGEVLFSHRIDLEYLTPNQEKQVREGLKRQNIHFEERQATHSDGPIQKGDRTLRISDKKSIEQLRSMVFYWASGRHSKPISMSVEEYNLMQENIAKKKLALPPQKTPVLPPEPERPFDWQDSMCWQDVKFQSNGEVLFSHRIRLEGLTPEQEKEVKEGLQKYHINFEERQASGDDGKIKKGDRTLRIRDKESIEQLRSMVFNWASQGRPVSMPVEAYNKQAMDRELLKKKLPSKS